MSTTTIVAKGIVKPDGSLELTEPLALPPGPVEVLIRMVPSPASTSGDWWAFLQSARARRETEGHHFRTREEIDAEIEDLRSGDERLEEVFRQIAAQRQLPE